MSFLSSFSYPPLFLLQTDKTVLNSKSCKALCSFVLEHFIIISKNKKQSKMHFFGLKFLSFVVVAMFTIAVHGQDPLRKIYCDPFTKLIV
jgi:hypothetical protein